MAKYDLIIYGRVVKSIITETLNREVVLVDLIKKANGIPFRIIVTEDKNKSLILDSKKDKPFINSLIYNDTPKFS